ncbi:MAG: tRNA lysidine(34) synthetase TilS [Rubritepida sp.]|nr:tRNA lysidine(34) synthetase TilS [Rubritepida sp.]
MPNAGDVTGATPIAAAEFAALMAPLGPFSYLIAVGCSGGPDSLGLTRLADDWARVRGGSALALIVEHGLRAESAAEAATLAAGLAAEGIAARILPLGLPPGPGLQERARLARRAALLAACREEGALHLLLGHHAEDQAETVLFRALRGSGPRGLAGMAPLTVAPDALILRPMLGTSRARLAASLEGWSIRPIQDPSNADPRFSRARLRATGELLAASAAAASFARRRARFAAADAVRIAASICLLPEGCAAIQRDRLGQDAVARRVMAALIRAVGGGEHAPPEAAVAALLARGSGTLGGARWLSGGRWLVREAGADRSHGDLWDGRFRSLSPLPADMMLGALGPDAARFRGRARHLPAAALAMLPALRQPGNEALALVPHLAYPDPELAVMYPLIFAPLAGPITESSD